MIKLFFGIIVGAGIVWFLTRIFKPVPYINSNQVEEKRVNLEKVLVIAHTHGMVTNNDVQKAINVSDATAERYLAELESQKKLVQVGQTGTSVSYKLP